MNFLNPWGFLGLLALPAIIALHFFRRRYQPLKSATTMLWQQLRERDAAGRTPRPIRSSLSLWLQLLAALLATLMLAGPEMSAGLGAKELIIVLDSAYSLQARRPKGDTVADAVRAEITKRLAARTGIETRAPVTVVEHGATSRLLSARRASLADARAIVARWQPTQPRATWATTLQMLQLWELEKCEVWVFTDRLTDDWKQIPGIELVSLGNADDNLALGEVSRTRLPDAKTERIRAAIHNFSGQTRDTEILIGTDRRRVTVPANAAQPVEVDLPVSAEPVELQLPADPLGFDNRVVLAPMETRPISVLFDFHAEGLLVPWTRALRAATTFDVAVVASNQPVTAQLILSDDERWLHTEDNAACVIVCAANVTDPKLYRAPFLSEPNHPLLRGLDWSGTLLALGQWPGRQFTPQLPRVSARDTAVLAEVPSRAARKFILHADLARGNFTRQPAFPVLAHNAVELARSFQPGLRTANVRHGDRIEYRPPRDAAEICVSQGDWKQCHPPSAGVRVPPDRHGLFELRAPGAPASLLAINHLDPPTSDLRALVPGHYKTRPASAATVARTLHNEWMIGLMLALLALVIGEWAYIQRNVRHQTL